MTEHITSTPVYQSVHEIWTA